MRLFQIGIGHASIALTEMDSVIRKNAALAQEAAAQFVKCAMAGYTWRSFTGSQHGIDRDKKSRSR